MLLVDETCLSDRLRVMVVALAYRQRALPLAWRCYLPDQWPMGQVALIDELLGRVQEGMRHAGMGDSSRVIVQADRGIGTSPDLVDAIQRRGWDFLFRVQWQTRIRLADGQEQPISDLVTRRGRRVHVPAEAFKKAGWRRCWAIGRWRRKQKQPWLLLTSDASLSSQHYTLRMWEEEAFRDLKSFGWQWQSSRVWKPEHAERLWLAMALAYTWTVSLGTVVIRSRAKRRKMCRGKRRRYSVFRLGLRYVQWCLHQGRKLLAELFLVPRPLPG